MALNNPTRMIKDIGDVGISLDDVDKASENLTKKRKETGFFF